MLGVEYLSTLVLACKSAFAIQFYWWVWWWCFLKDGGTATPANNLHSRGGRSSRSLAAYTARVCRQWSLNSVGTATPTVCTPTQPLAGHTGRSGGSAFGSLPRPTSQTWPMSRFLGAVPRRVAHREADHHREASHTDRSHHPLQQSDPKCPKAQRNRRLESSKHLRTLRPAKFNIFAQFLECMMLFTARVLQGKLSVILITYYISSSKYVLKLRRNP